MKLPIITDVENVAGKYALVCMAADVPIKDGVVQNQFRIIHAIPTLKCLVAGGARVILFGHVGRKPENTMQPIYDVLAEQFDIVWAGALVGDEVTAKRKALQNGQILMLENSRSDPREKANDESLARELAALGDFYVNDDFPTSHREHAAYVSIPKHLPTYAGIAFHAEYEELGNVRTPKAPALFMIGGAKFETKQPLVEQFLDLYDHIFVCGALANDFYKARGHNVGTSLVSDQEITDEALIHNPKILLPTDVVVEGPNGVRTTTPDDVQADEAILDAGPATIEMLAPHVNEAKTILWNGPLGNYEDGFAEGTLALAQLVADSDAYSVVGGGDTIAAIESIGLNDHFDFLSTAGGAMLTYLEVGTLPGIEAILHSHE